MRRQPSDRVALVRLAAWTSSGQRAASTARRGSLSRHVSRCAARGYRAESDVRVGNRAFIPHQELCEGAGAGSIHCVAPWPRGCSVARSCPSHCRRRQAGRGDLGASDAGVASVRIAGHEALILLVLVSAPPGLMATFTASSIGSLKGTSIRSNPFSYVAWALLGFTGQPKASAET